MKKFFIALVITVMGVTIILASPTEDAEKVVREGVTKVLAITEKSQGGLSMAEQIGRAHV